MDVWSFYSRRRNICDVDEHGDAGHFDACCVSPCCGGCDGSGYSGLGLGRRAMTALHKLADFKLTPEGGNKRSSDILPMQLGGRW